MSDARAARDAGSPRDDASPGDGSAPSDDTDADLPLSPADGGTDGDATECADGAERMTSVCGTEGAGQLRDVCVAGTWAPRGCSYCGYPELGLQRIDGDNAEYVLQRIGVLERATVDTVSAARTYFDEAIATGGGTWPCHASTYDGTAGMYESGRVVHVEVQACATGVPVGTYEMALTQDGSVAFDFFYDGAPPAGLMDAPFGGHDIRLSVALHLAYEDTTGATSALTRFDMASLPGTADVWLDIEGHPLELSVEHWSEAVSTEDIDTETCADGGCTNVLYTRLTSTRDAAYAVIDPHTNHGFTVATLEPLVLEAYGPDAGVHAFRLLEGARSVVDVEGRRVRTEPSGAPAQAGSPPPSTVLFDADGPDGGSSPLTVESGATENYWDLPSGPVDWPWASPNSCDAAPLWPFTCAGACATAAAPSAG